jgi:hypothetical protein
MKVNCENVVRCANTDCDHNLNGYSCFHIVVAIGSDGRCALCKPKDRPTQDKSNKSFDIETSK